MSRRGTGDITLFCEDAPNGPSAKLFSKILDNHFPEFHNRIRVKGVGSKTTIDGILREARQKGDLCFAIRDRDFLPSHLLKERNANPFKNHQAWSLERHCIESYSLDDDALADKYRELRDQEAEKRKWVDLARAVKEAGLNSIRNRRVKAPLDKESVTDEETARRSLHAFFADLGSLVDCDAEMTRLKAEFDQHPLWKRVDGKALLKSLRGQGFVVPSMPEPASLIAELRLLISQMPNDW